MQQIQNNWDTSGIEGIERGFQEVLEELELVLMEIDMRRFDRLRLGRLCSELRMLVEQL
ncbi:hypothetical protein [Aeromonas hydrophila]|uniref:hypothetical protein n=1 Tax=Aeromonas hydrophila TaxID=644 RepID=UPI0012D36EF2|nr:hypothetical protein [Aeromonas hydrophila]